MGATASALDKINNVAEEGDLTTPPLSQKVDMSGLADPITLPDGKVIYPPRLHGEPVHELAAKLIDLKHPSRSRFLQLVGPPGTGKSQIARAIAYELWKKRGRKVETINDQPFYGFKEMSPGPSSDEFFFRHEFVPAADDGGRVTLVDSAFVQAMREGLTVMIDEVNVARDVALLSINATLDGRLSLYLAATGETVVAKPGFCVILAYNPGLVGATDLPDAWYSRFPAMIEVSSNWAALVKLGAPEPLVAAAQRLDGQRLSGEEGLVWTPQFRDIEALADMMDRVGERAAVSLFISNLYAQQQTGRVQDAELAAVTRMLDEAGYNTMKMSVRARKESANAEGYARAVAR